MSKSEATPLEEEAARLLELLGDLDPTTEEYVAVSKQYAILTTLAREGRESQHRASNDKLNRESTEAIEAAKLEAAREARNTFSKDAVLAAATSIGGIVILLSFEKLGAGGIITSKALGFITKVRI